MRERFGWTAFTAVVAVAGLTGGLAPAWADGSARVLQVDFQPAADDLQIAVWLEDSSDNFVDTLFVTRAIGTFGIGNRPGAWDLKSGFRWPYGRRTNSLPIWAYKQGKTYPLVVFAPDPLNRPGNGDTTVAYHSEDSSPEAYFCRPLTKDEPYCYRVNDTSPCINTTYPLTSSHGQAAPPLPPNITVDAITCPSVATLSKGRYTTDGRTTVYPPRNDLTMFTPTDDSSTRQYSTDNTLDTVSRATPPKAAPYSIYYMYGALGDGDYVLWLEANREFDPNMFFEGMDLHDFQQEWDFVGAQHQGQPSVVFKVPVQIRNGAITVGQTMDYVGYGSVDGSDGTIRPPDGMIETQIPGSGAARLAVVTQGSATFRVRTSPAGMFPPFSDPGVSTGPDGGPVDGGSGGHLDCDPIVIPNFVVSSADPGTVTLAVTTPNIRDINQLADYDLRYRAGQPIAATEADFSGATPGPGVPIGKPGEVVLVTVGGLKPQTHYYFAIRTRGICAQVSPILLADRQTPGTPFTTLHGCFVATAAYGSVQAASIGALRSWRDQLLLPTRGGRALVAGYYFVSPTLAGYIAPDEDLRRVTRGLLVPFVEVANLVAALR